MKELLKGFPVIIDIPVAWGEMDAFQHVNNTVYFRWFESGRITYFIKMGIIDHMEATGIGPILAAADCRFKAPLTYPDTVSVGTKISLVEESQFTMQYRVVSQRLKRVAADGSGLIVTYNYRLNQRAAVPEVIKERIAEIECSNRQR